MSKNAPPSSRQPSESEIEQLRRISEQRQKERQAQRPTVVKLEGVDLTPLFSSGSRHYDALTMTMDAEESLGINDGRPKLKAITSQILTDSANDLLAQFAKIGIVQGQETEIEGVSEHAVAAVMALWESVVGLAPLFDRENAARRARYALKMFEKVKKKTSDYVLSMKFRSPITIDGTVATIIGTGEKIHLQMRDAKVLNVLLQGEGERVSASQAVEIDRTLVSRDNVKKGYESLKKITALEPYLAIHKGRSGGMSVKPEEK